MHVIHTIAALRDLFARGLVGRDGLRRLPGIPRLIQDGRTGFLVEPGDLDGLTRSLHGLLTNPGLRTLFRAAARRFLLTLS